MSTEQRTENVERELGAARHVDLVSARGQTRVWVRTGEDGPKLILLDKSGEVIGVLYVTKDKPEKLLFNQKEDLWAELAVPTDTMYLNLYDAAQNVQSSLGTADLPSIVELHSAEDKKQVVIRVEAANLEFLLHDAGGNKRASLAMGKGVGHLCLFDENEKPIWSAP